MKKYLLLSFIFIWLSSCSKKPNYKSIKQQAIMSSREARKKIKNRHKVAMMDKRNCPEVKKSGKEKRLMKKEGKKQPEEQQ